MSNFQYLQKRAFEIREKYSQLNTDHGHQPWDGKAFTMGFMGDLEAAFSDTMNELDARIAGGRE